MSTSAAAYKTVPIFYQIDKDRGVIRTTASGRLTDEELLAHKRKLMADSQFQPGMVELTDGTQISDFAVSTDGIRRFTQQDAEDAHLLENYKLAIVVTQDIAFGMARMYQMMTSENVSNIEVFRDFDAAKAWLDITE